ncbi:MAG: PIN domain-containing protein [Acaryochloridaceae cyanobacterium RU_4_10]|nr:PIN domain-containing protein [Acaryochloridaceae cyanobacterium RU_4_10]
MALDLSTKINIRLKICSRNTIDFFHQILKSFFQQIMERLNRVSRIMNIPSVVLDTNIFVASSFKPKSHSAKIVEQVRGGHLRMIWSEQTRHETEFIVRKIPPLSWRTFEALFRQENCYAGELFPERFHHIPDKDDIKFAALSDATGATLITMDKDLLDIRDALSSKVLMPFEFINELHTTESSFQLQPSQSQ